MSAKERQARYRARNPKCNRKNELWRKYGLTEEEYRTLMILQGGCCAACGQPETKTNRGVLQALSVDHDHETGAVRGLLCAACNTALGLLQEDVSRMRALELYINTQGVTTPASTGPDGQEV